MTWQRSIKLKYFKIIMYQFNWKWYQIPYTTFGLLAKYSLNIVPKDRRIFLFFGIQISAASHTFCSFFSSPYFSGNSLCYINMWTALHFTQMCMCYHKEAVVVKNSTLSGKLPVTSCCRFISVFISKLYMIFCGNGIYWDEKNMHTHIPLTDKVITFGRNMKSKTKRTGKGLLRCVINCKCICGLQWMWMFFVSLSDSVVCAVVFVYLSLLFRCRYLAVSVVVMLH